MKSNLALSFSGKTGQIYLSDFEEILNNSEVIIFSETRIEIPGIVIFSKAKHCLLSQIFNPGMEILSVEPSDFEKMIESLKIKEEKLVFFDLGLKQGGTVRVNLAKIKENLVLIRKDKNLLILNNILFTSNEIEFHGTGMFTFKELSFLVEPSVLEHIENYMFS